MNDEEFKKYAIAKLDSYKSRETYKFNPDKTKASIRWMINSPKYTFDEKYSWIVQCSDYEDLVYNIKLCWYEYNNK
ncbi:hypothetical protein A4_223 [Escherichia phage A4]|nr:hypothetical protein A4_223 [Escherichia phage A4]